MDIDNLDDFMKGRVEEAKAAVVDRYGPGILQDVALGLELLASYVKEAPTILDKLNTFDLVLLAVSHKVVIKARGQHYVPDGEQAWFSWPQGDAGYAARLLDTVSIPISSTQVLHQLSYMMTHDEVVDLRTRLLDKFAQEASQDAGMFR